MNFKIQTMPCLVFKTGIAHVLVIIDNTFRHSVTHIDGAETDLREVCLFCLEDSLDNFTNFAPTMRNTFSGLDKYN